MAEALWRLLWALPTVLVAGALIVALLRRLSGTAPKPEVKSRLRLVESLGVSDRTRMHLVESDTQVLVVLEGDTHLMVHWVPTSDQANGPPSRRQRGPWSNLVQRAAR